MNNNAGRSIKMLNLGKLYASHRDECRAAIDAVLDQTAYIGGKELNTFQQEFAEWVGGDCSVVGSANGTDAITVAARALKLPPDSEAIVPAMTYIATVAGLIQAGLKVKLVDVTPDTWLLDPAALEKAITPKTKLIVPVHFYGQMAEMDRIRAIADRTGCLILEDAAQAHGSLWKGQPVGKWGDIATYSFYPGKNLGAFGDAGAILSRNKSLIEYCTAYGNHGGLIKYQHDFIGCNSRLDNVHAAVLRVKLRSLSAWNESRRNVAKAYKEGLSNIAGLQLPVEHPDSYHTYHLYVVLTERRNDLMAFLKERGIETGIHYPRAIHQQPALHSYAGEKFPNAEKVSAQCVSLPMCPTLVPDEVQFVIEAVREFYGA